MGREMGNVRVFSPDALTRYSFLIVLFLLTSVARAQSPTTPQGPQQGGEKRPGTETPMEFQSHNLEYEALTKNGITVMFATLPPHIKDFNIVQVTITNGSLVSWTVKPSDFSFVRQSGVTLQPVSADEVVESLLQKASRT